MKWSELIKIAIEHGWRLKRHGKKHDIYYHPDKSYFIEMERHESQEVIIDMKKIIALIEKGEDGLFGVHAPELENVIIGSGETVEEAKEDFMDGYNEMIETYIDDGKSVPEELKNVEFEYRYDISAFYNAHPYLNVSKLAKHMHINASLMRQYKHGQYISEEQILRIQDGIRMVGKELSTITLVR